MTEQEILDVFRQTGALLSGQRTTPFVAPARTETGTSVAGGQPVKISRVVGTQFYVVPA